MYYYHIEKYVLVSKTKQLSATCTSARVPQITLLVTSAPGLFYQGSFRYLVTSVLSRFYQESCRSVGRFGLCSSLSQVNLAPAGFDQKTFQYRVQSDIDHCVILVAGRFGPM